jgi:hypothetical protein
MHFIYLTFSGERYLKEIHPEGYSYIIKPGS